MVKVNFVDFFNELGLFRGATFGSEQFDESKIGREQNAERGLLEIARGEKVRAKNA